MIGGDNGRGKTSIHEAINYALYMDDDLPGIATKPNYLKAVSDRLNRRALDAGDTDYWVAVEISSDEFGSPRTLRIQRTWKVNLRERFVTGIDLEITENGRPLETVDRNTEEYQDFLRNLLPPRIAPLFFFDGERIQEFAEDETHDKKMREAILDILHITTYRRLHNDLRKYVIDHLERHEATQDQADDYYDLVKDAERLEQQIETKGQRFRENEWEQDETRRELKQVEEELRRVTIGPTPTKRDELVAGRESLQAQLESVREELERAYQPLPLLLVGNLVDEVERSLMHFAREDPDGLRAKLDLVEEETFGRLESVPEQLRLDFEQETLYRGRFRSASRSVFRFGDQPPAVALHDVSERDRRRILERIAELKGTSTMLKDLIDRRERLESEVRGVEERLRATADDPEINELIDRSKQLSKRVGELETESKSLTGELQRLQADLAKRRAQIEKLRRAREAKTQAMKTIQLASRAQSALQIFIKRLAPEKLCHLRKHFEDMYFRLKKPEDPACRVEIDQESWRVTLFDDQDRPLEKRVFSAGMKEIYALSLLWALSKASGRELPIVIDTPAGRLDTTNRRALFEKYLPHAGHQVIVLSTDTEVDVKWAQRLEPFVARQYRLDYDESRDSIVIRPGYFF